MSLSIDKTIHRLFVPALFGSTTRYIHMHISCISLAAILCPWKKNCQLSSEPKTPEEHWKAQNKRNSCEVYFLQELSMICGGLPSWKSIAEPSTLFLKKPFGLCVTTHLFFLIFFFVSLCRLMAWWLHGVERKINQKDKSPPCPDPSCVATNMTMARAVYMWRIHASWSVTASLSWTTFLYLTDQFHNWTQVQPLTTEGSQICINIFYVLCRNKLLKALEYIWKKKTDYKNPYIISQPKCYPSLCEVLGEKKKINYCHFAFISYVHAVPMCVPVLISVAHKTENTS